MEISDTTNNELSEPIQASETGLTNDETAKAYPTETPAALEQPESAIQRKACARGLIIGFALSLLIAIVAPKNSMLGRMFDIKNVGTVIPALITCLFFWGAMSCFLRRKRIRALAEMEREVSMPEILNRIEQNGLEKMEQELASLKLEASPTIRRLLVILGQWRQKADLQEADVVLQRQVEHDEEALHSGYGLVRLFVWALPVVGLIGTVIGISLAVGGFATFLGGNIDDVMEIKKNLVSVTGGLSFAFLITLEGLATSLILMFAASSIQDQEQKVFSEVQKSIVEVFLPRLQQLYPESKLSQTSTQPEVLEIWRTCLRESGQRMLESVRDGALKSASDQNAQQKEQRQIAAQMLHAFVQKVQEATFDFRGSLDAAAQTLGAGIGGLTQEVKELQTTMAAYKNGMSQLLENNAGRIDQQNKSIADSVGRQIDLISSNKTAIESLAQATQAAVVSQVGIQKALADIANADLKPIFGEFSESLRIQSTQFMQLNQAITMLIQGTERMVDTHSKLQVATRELHETGLGQSLTSVRDSLADLRPVLEGFRGPFVFQAVPVSGGGGNHA
jgi:biopolymer transport protein ExbB/TolQ